MTDIIKGNNGNLIVFDGKPYAVIISVEGTPMDVPDFGDAPADW